CAWVVSGAGCSAEPSGESPSEGAPASAIVSSTSPSSSSIFASGGRYHPPVLAGAALGESGWGSGPSPSDPLALPAGGSAAAGSSGEPTGLRHPPGTIGRCDASSADGLRHPSNGGCSLPSGCCAASSGCGFFGSRPSAIPHLDLRSASSVEL